MITALAFVVHYFQSIFCIILSLISMIFVFLFVDAVGIIFKRGQNITNARNEQQRFLELVIGNEM